MLGCALNICADCHGTAVHMCTKSVRKCAEKVCTFAQEKFPGRAGIVLNLFLFNFYHGNPQKSIQFCRKKSFAHLHKCTEKFCAAAQCVSVQVAIYALNSCASAKCIYAHYPKECMSRYGGYQSTNGRFVFVLAANWSLRSWNF